MRTVDQDPEHIDTICAGDFLNHYLFREFLRGLKLVSQERSKAFRIWLGIEKRKLDMTRIAKRIASWPCWFDYYKKCASFDGLLAKCNQRLSVWLSFLNANTDEIPSDVWATKSVLGEPMHAMGNELRRLLRKGQALPLFVVIDQYEQLPELNRSHGTSLQRAVNSLVKGRDPTVFYKLGARTYDWGKELRIFGAESRIEVQRDYVIIDLTEVLTRKEDPSDWIFPDLVQDIAYKRIAEEGRYPDVTPQAVKNMLGSKPDPEQEALLYFPPEALNAGKLLKGIPNAIRRRIIELTGPDPSALELRLAAAWVMQRLQRNDSESDIFERLDSRPWQQRWWRKERVDVALLQLASLANQRRYYYGWETILSLSGGNIAAFLLLLRDIWDQCAKIGHDPPRAAPLDRQVQTAGAFSASEAWRVRDRNEGIGGRHRYTVVAHIGAAISGALMANVSLSNPGHSGFSLSESALNASPEGEQVREFLENAVSWSILEERRHTSKRPGEGPTRRKWYLHPLLSPAFATPHVRVKEPLYIEDVKRVHDWIFENAKVDLDSRRRRPTGRHKQLSIEDIP
jgi:hypothetical protein